MQNQRVATRRAIFFLMACSLLAVSAQAAFPGENGKIYFAGCAGDGTICSIPAPPAVAEPTVVVNDAFPGTLFDVSPDGRKLVYFTSNFDIFVKDLETQSQPQFIVRGSNPGFRADCSGIVYNNGNAIWTINLSGSGLRRILDATGGWHRARVSPDGSYLLLLDDLGLTLTAPGKQLRRIFTEPENLGQRIRTFDWSPDGQEIVFYRILGLLPELASQIRHPTRSSPSQVWYKGSQESGWFGALPTP